MSISKTKKYTVDLEVDEKGKNKIPCLILVLV